MEKSLPKIATIPIGVVVTVTGAFLVVFGFMLVLGKSTISFTPKI